MDLLGVQDPSPSKRNWRSAYGPVPEVFCRRVGSGSTTPVGWQN